MVCFLQQQHLLVVYLAPIQNRTIETLMRYSLLVLLAQEHGTRMPLYHCHKPVLLRNGHCFKFATSHKKCAKHAHLVYQCIFHKDKSLKVWWKKFTTDKVIQLQGPWQCTFLNRVQKNLRCTNLCCENLTQVVWILSYTRLPFPKTCASQGLTVLF
jgi:hypothetical protein